MIYVEHTRRRFGSNLFSYALLLRTYSFPPWSPKPTFEFHSLAECLAGTRIVGEVLCVSPKTARVNARLSQNMGMRVVVSRSTDYLLKLVVYVVLHIYETRNYFCSPAEAVVTTSSGIKQAVGEITFCFLP